MTDNTVTAVFAIGAECGILIDHEDRKPSTDDLIDKLYEYNFGRIATELQKGVYSAEFYWNDGPQYKEEVFMKNMKILWRNESRYLKDPHHAT